MTFTDFWRREKHVALNAQTRKFRIIKWIVIGIVGTVLYMWEGWGVVIKVFILGGIAGITLHFFLRWKSDGWTKSWGPYKRIRLDGE